MSAATDTAAVADAGLRITRDGAVARIVLARAATGNRIAQSAVVQLAAELRSIAADHTVKLVVLSADGDHFCQGREQGPVTATAKPSALELRARMMDPIVAVYAAFREVQVPIISLVQGEAHGFGAALAASADLTVAADNARFSFPELKTDMPPTLAMATVMDRVAPKALAWMVYTNEVIDAQTALQIGMVSRVVPTSELAATGDALVAQLLERSHAALSGVKQYMARARLQHFHEAADTGRNLLAVVLSSK
ncbi:enoyl-CoA hydratase/isomerase family protein [Hydrogenophaga sp.]|uniref:enoyl-CoA hydratase/isomerase family protein n=1 Tax=Hydrogenophaga sp. TaxID=1904254 RepID=UPI00271DE9E9|nr:enoyl-CoA hydratase/isomerase family protein [Hydrogenophaga sp.]MDO9434398.1 enoyl-CoA hydratase/isomerase family protein [Hydrogenophaga sp.]